MSTSGEKMMVKNEMPSVRIAVKRKQENSYIDSFLVMLVMLLVREQLVQPGIGPSGQRISHVDR